MDNEQDDLQLKESFLTFLERDEKDNPEYDSLEGVIDRQENRLIVNLDNLRAYDTELDAQVRDKPAKVVPAMEKALNEVVRDIDSAYLQQTAAGTMHIAFEGTMGKAKIGPRELSSRFLGSLVSVDGILTKCGLVRPKLAHSVQYSAASKEFTERTFRDIYSLGGLPTQSSMPQKDAENNPLTTEYGLCKFQDHQACTLQEMPENSPPGQLPRHVELILGEDLVDFAKPGDRVRIYGIFKAVSGGGKGGTSGVFRTVILCNNMQLLAKELYQPKLSEQDFQDIRKVAKSKRVFEELSESIAPSIFGHEYIKRGLLLMLLGGVEKNLDNGTHLRGDINVLMVGDPSTAKSQLLRFILNMAPLAINTTGRGSSGVGLTAAVTTDSETGDRTLQAGAMVLADRGVVCIDEFDKMSDVDRVAIHEVMEQQTVTIAKAGIHASLNARCSVLAAANPIYGQYDTSKPPEKNIALPDSLLSRFDLLFIVKDNVQPDIDRSIADHVLKMHQYRMTREDEEDEEERQEAMQTEAPMYEQGIGSMRGKKLFSIPFMKKYIMRAKRLEPKLTEEAVEKIAEEYKEIRMQSENGRTLPVTARTLETIIRLSTAHAKCRMQRNVTEDDVDVATSLMKFALYSEKTVEDEEPGQDDDGSDGDGPVRDPRRAFALPPAHGNRDARSMPAFPRPCA
jgi:DNA replication licensing factor MCM3